VQLAASEAVGITLASSCLAWRDRRDTAQPANSNVRGTGAPVGGRASRPVSAWRSIAYWRPAARAGRHGDFGSHCSGKSEEEVRDAAEKARRRWDLLTPGLGTSTGTHVHSPRLSMPGASSIRDALEKASRGKSCAVSLVGSITTRCRLVGSRTCRATRSVLLEARRPRVDVLLRNDPAGAETIVR